MRNLAVLTVLMLFAGSGAALAPTFYEQPDVVGHDRLYDDEKNMMLLQERWVDGKIVTHYGFRMYTPIGYQIGPLSGPADVLPQPMYIASTDQTLEGIPEGQKPLLLNHHINATGQVNTFYNDIMHIMLVIVPEDYVANTHTSGLELLNYSKILHTTGIIVNAPLVPTGATLEDPYNRGQASPVQPWISMAGGDEEAWHYVFETNSKEFANWINERTRPADLDPSLGLHSDWVPNFADVHSAKISPVYNFEIFGDGGRDVASKDRQDLGYGPLRRVHAFNHLPVNYEANEARHNRDITNGPFDHQALVFWWNTPQVGPYGGVDAPAQENQWATGLGTGMNKLRGVIWDHSMVPVEARQGDTVLATGTTNDDGVWELLVDGSKVSQGTVEIYQGGEVITTYTVKGQGDVGATVAVIAGIMTAMAIVLVILLIKKKNPQDE